MNILPKKRWHVRTRENIARVRKDELEAAEEAARKKQRIEQADREARATLLRQRAKDQFGIKDEVEDIIKKEPCSSAYSGNKHINFFEEIEEGKVVTTKTNEETVKEEKAKREAYEKRIGYLTYLGQDTVELTGKKPWYDKVPDRLKYREAQSVDETNVNSKLVQDPLTLIRRFVPSVHEVGGVKQPETTGKSSELCLKRERKGKKPKKKSKKHKRKSNSSCSSSDHETDKKSGKRKRKSKSNYSDESETEEKKEVEKSLEQLRAERLKREKQEQKRADELLSQLKVRTTEKNNVKNRSVHQKYNSQFNPRIANQNYRRDPRNR